MNIKVKHFNLSDLTLHKLRELRALNLGIDGMMFHPIRLTIAYKMGKPTQLGIVSKMHRSKVAVIELDGKVVSWGLLLSEVKPILDRRADDEGVKDHRALKYEIHLFTHKAYRGRGFATQIARSIKRKYPKTKFFGYWDESSIFCKNNLLHLQDKERERSIKQRPARVVGKS